MATKKILRIILFFSLLLAGSLSWVQGSEIDEDQIGAWYMYFWSTELEDRRFGFQGDTQLRNWKALGDLEQLLLRGGFTYSPESLNIKFTLGYAYVLSGEFGDSSETSNESRIYQELSMPQELGDRIHINHRFRFEQRWVENQDFRTRFRYGLFANVGLNKKQLVKGTFYYAFYNEIFVNGQRDIGNGREVELFDRNRFYNAIGYCLTDELRFQGGYMYQVTDDWEKGQLQFSLHHSF
jgi:hypothetical protein